MTTKEVTGWQAATRSSEPETPESMGLGRKALLRLRALLLLLEIAAFHHPLQGKCVSREQTSRRKENLSHRRDYFGKGRSERRRPHGREEGGKPEEGDGKVIGTNRPFDPVRMQNIVAQEPIANSAFTLSIFRLLFLYNMDE